MSAVSVKPIDPQYVDIMYKIVSLDPTIVDAMFPILLSDPNDLSVE